MKPKFHAGDEVKHALGMATFVGYYGVKCVEIIFDGDTGKSIVHKDSIQKI